MLKLIGMVILFVVAVMALVCAKVGMWPTELYWIDEHGITSVVWAILVENRLDVAALALVALNGLWLWVRIDSSKHTENKIDHVDQAALNDGIGDGTNDNQIDIAPQAIPDMADSFRSANQQLQVATSEISRLKKELVLKRQELVAANSAKAQFMANMSHELRTPMNGIVGMAELLQGAELPARETRFVSSIASSAESLLSIINDLLDFSNIETGMLQLEHTRFNLRDCVEDVCSLLAERAHSKNIELICYVDDDIPVLVAGDANRLRQILNNIVNNAISFTDEGEVVVRMTGVAQSETKDTYQCDVQDTGRGIAPELQARMFEAFTQADSSSTRSHGGLGMGLAITHELVARMDGEISFKSRLGEGSRFTFTVKLDRVESDVMKRIGGRSLQGARILIVDDNETNRTILYHQLSNWGILAETVECAKSALSRLQNAAVQNKPYDLLILDLHMPETDGLELARQIQADESIADIKSLMLTSAVLEQSAEQLHELGIDAYISKPARQSLLYTSIASLMPNAVAVNELDNNITPVVRLLPLGAKVLLAEDNLVNQDVAFHMLELIGCQVTVVSNGAQAIQSCELEKYDLIFMDCQMPVLDGYIATMQIKEGASANSSTPVVALTASALEGDREKCLCHGMDDYISKPVRQDQLYNALNRWASGTMRQFPEKKEALDADCPRNSDSSESASSQNSVQISKYWEESTSLDHDLGESMETNVAMLTVLNEKSLNTIRSLQRPGKVDLLGKIAGMYIDKTPGMISDMQSALVAGDLSVIKACAHSLKSSSAYLGADSLSDKCRQIESLIADSDTETIAVVIDAIAAEYDAVQQILHGFIKAA